MRIHVLFAQNVYIYGMKAGLQRHLVSLLSYSHQAFVSFPNPSSSFFERVTYLSTVNKMPVMFPRGHVAGGKYGSVMLQVVVVVIVMLQVVVVVMVMVFVVIVVMVVVGVMAVGHGGREDRGDSLL